MTNKLLVTTVLVLISIPAFAKVAQVAVPVPAKVDTVVATVPSAELKERTTLAEQFAKVHPIKPRIDATIDMLGNGIAPEQRTKYFADMQKNLDYKTIEDASIKSMAQTFTPAELKKMIEYYSSPEGISIEKKTPDYEAKLQPAVKTALDAAITKIKYGTKIK